MSNLSYFRRFNQGFAPVELLVIVAVVGMFAMLGFSASEKWNNQMKIAQCANNLRQLNLSQLLYGAENLDRLPAGPTIAGGWPWDLTWFAGPELNKYGTAVKSMYCPGTAPRFNATRNNQLYNFAIGNFHIIGYSLSLPNEMSLATTNINFSTIPQPISAGPTVLPPPSASQRVLTADANLSSGGNYTSVPGGYLVPHMSPHLDGMVPAGGNVGMLDGHVEWRPFQRMIVRTIAGPMPSFYW